MDGWDPFAEDAPMLAGLSASSVRGVAALGPRAGRPVRRWGSEVARGRVADASRVWHARVRGFDLHAAVAVRAGARDRLERMCRYALRPAVGQERLRDPVVVARILRHLGLPDAVPVPRAGRAPPLPWEGYTQSAWPDVG